MFNMHLKREFFFNVDFGIYDFNCYECLKLKNISLNSTRFAFCNIHRKLRTKDFKKKKTIYFLYKHDHVV